MKIYDAIPTADYFKNLLEPACNRIEIVGSVKRCYREEVHDIEILMILNGKKPQLEFGNKKIYLTMLDKIIDGLLNENVLKQPTRKANGPKYKKFAIVQHSPINEFCLDLFIVTPETWGIQNVIRTGPSLFSHSFVTNKNVSFYDDTTGHRYEGLLPVEYEYLRGETRIAETDGEVLDLPEEADALTLLGHGWIEPKERRNYIRRLS